MMRYFLGTLWYQLCIYLMSRLAEHVHPFMPTVYPQSQSSNHLTLVSWKWKGVHCTQMGSTATRSQSTRSDGMRDSQHGRAATVWRCNVNINQNRRNIYSTLLTLCLKESGHFKRQMVRLIKWPMSLHTRLIYTEEIFVASSTFLFNSSSYKSPTLLRESK